MTKIVFCYPIVNGYIAACWRALAKQDGVDLSVVSFAPDKKDNVAFSSDVMKGLDHHVVPAEQRTNADEVAALVRSLKPDALFVSGWHNAAFRKLYTDRMLADVPIALVMDNPFRGDLRQFIGRHVLARLLRRVRYLFVTGERAHQLGRYWNVPREKIVRGCVSVDYSALAPQLERRLADGAWPKSFLFVGRYVPEKALDALVEGYRLYRREHEDPWPLKCAGTGPDAALLQGEPGIEDLGFVDPELLQVHWKEAGCFVITSRFDPWPLVVVEACAAGLPVVATDACGSTVENVRDLHNGFIAPEPDPGHVAAALSKAHLHHSDLPAMGRRSQQFAEAYSAEAWCTRAMEMVASMVAR